jgi:polysaccharide export outer membrane protein
MKVVTLLSCVAMASTLAGCSSFPTAGPTTSQLIKQAGTKDRPNFALVEVDDKVVTTLASEPTESFRYQFAQYGKPTNPKIGVGDTISVSIWDSSGGGIFGVPPMESAPGPVAGTPSTGARTVSIPEEVVARDGAISIPYAGRVPVANRTPLQVQQTIQQLLAKTAFDPQVVVTITKSVSQSVTISGETIGGAHVPLSVRGERLLDVIADAGGSKSALYETFVRLSRNGVTASILLAKLVSDPGENIYVWPGDIITLVKSPQTFLAFGATQTNTQIPFGADKINLAQGVAKAGGLLDSRADPAGVFLFRFEPSAVMTALGEPIVASSPNGPSRVVYHVNFRDISGYFLARRFLIRDDDIIYIANAPMAELQKFFTMVGSIAAPVITTSGVARTAP